MPCWDRRRDWGCSPSSSPVPNTRGDTTRPRTLSSPSWNAVCRKESSKSRHRPSAQHWGSPPTTSSQLLGVFRPSGTKRERTEGSGRAEFPVVGQQGANSELYVSPTLLWRGCSPSESDLNPKPGAAQALPTPCLLPPAFSLSPASSALQTLLSYLEQLPSPQRPWPGGVHKGARLLGYFPTSGPKADPACSFLQPCSNDPAPSKVGGQELYWGWKMGSVVALPQAPHGPTPSLSPPPRCCLRVIHGATRTEIQGGHKMLTGKQLCEGHLKDKQK